MENRKDIVKVLIFNVVLHYFWYNQLIFWMTSGAIGIHRVKENKYYKTYFMG